MKGALRFFGLLNAGVWMGAAVFFLLGVAPSASSAAMQNLLGPRNYPFFSVALVQLLANRYFHLYLVCATLALLHTVAEWLYFGKYPPRVLLSLLLGLWLLGLAQDYWLQPRLQDLHRTLYQTQPLRPEQREALSHAFHVTDLLSGALNWLTLGGLGLYLWGLANPPDLPRFLSTNKFRS